MTAEAQETVDSPRMHRRLIWDCWVLSLHGSMNSVGQGRGWGGGDDGTVSGGQPRNKEKLIGQASGLALSTLEEPGDLRTAFFLQGDKEIPQAYVWERDAEREAGEGERRKKRKRKKR